MRGYWLFTALLGSACSSAPRIDSVELTRANLRVGEEAFLIMQIADEEAELNPPTVRMSMLPVADEGALETEVVLPAAPEGDTSAQVIVGLTVSGAVGLGTRSLELVVIDSGGAESEPWPLFISLTL